VALLLRKQGIQHIRPLQGGLDAWRDQGYPLANVTLTQISVTAKEAPITER
jgi:3-mercaptopyruvate sulfurtransferase SseA